jgi:uncharacterized protein with HEPN domain
MRREPLLLADILAAADAIAAFTSGCSFETFERSLLIRSAVVHQLAIIGEAVAHLTLELRSRHPEIPWTDIKGLRNVVVHNYFGTDWREIWSTVSADIPVLRRQIADILSREFDDAG